jgi:hypothetical protein
MTPSGHCPNLVKRRTPTPDSARQPTRARARTAYVLCNCTQTMDGFLDWVDVLLEDAEVPPFDHAWVKSAFARPRHER